MISDTVAHNPSDSQKLILGRAKIATITQFHKSITTKASKQHRAEIKTNAIINPKNFSILFYPLFNSMILWLLEPLNGKLVVFNSSLNGPSTMTST